MYGTLLEILVVLLLIWVLHDLFFSSVTSFEIFQGDYMSIVGIKSGATGVFVASTTPAGAVLPAGVVPSWVSSDPSSAPVVQTADGLGASVSVLASATITSFDLTISATLPDGTTPTRTVSVPVLPPEVTGFEINQAS